MAVVADDSKNQVRSGQGSAAVIERALDLRRIEAWYGCDSWWDEANSQC
jgi:hypothetical protein